MLVYFRGCWDVTVTSSLSPGDEYGSPKQFVIDGADTGSGTYGGDPDAIGFSVHVTGRSWTITVQNRNPFVGNAWVPSPVLVTHQGALVVIGANDDNSGDSGPYDDLILTCEPCHLAANLPRQFEGTWVSWGVKVDGGGPTGHGPVPPWSPFVKELAAGLALGEAAQLVRADLQSDVLELAAKQVNEAAAAITKAMKGGIKGL